MDIAVITALIVKYTGVIEGLVAAGKPIATAIDAFKKLFYRDRTVPPTDAEIAETEAVLDSLIDEFNIELPPE